MPDRPEFPSLCFRSLAENMPLALLVKDTTGKILFANKAYLEFSGRSLDKIVGKSDYEFRLGKTCEKISRRRRWKSLNPERLNLGFWPTQVKERRHFARRVSSDSHLSPTTGK